MHGSDESIMYEGVRALEVPCMYQVTGSLGVKVNIVPSVNLLLANAHNKVEVRDNNNGMIQTRNLEMSADSCSKNKPGALFTTQFIYNTNILSKVFISFL